METTRERARNVASQISSSLPYGEAVRIITSALKDQTIETDLKYKELTAACAPLMSHEELSPTGKDIFKAMTNLAILQD